jgi:hypothetical protein
MMIFSKGNKNDEKMKIRPLFYLIYFLSIGITPQAKAATMPVDSIKSYQTVQNNTKNKFLLFKRTEEKKSITYGKIGKILGFVFLGLMLLVPIVHFQARLTLVIMGLLAGILAIIFGLIGMSKAKDETSTKKARKSFWIILGIIAGILLLSILVGLIVLFTVGFA